MVQQPISEKQKKEAKRERDLKWMENFKIESRYLKFRNEFSAVIRCIGAVFYRPDYQTCPLIKSLGQAFVSKHAADALKGSSEFLKHSAKLLRV